MILQLITALLLCCTSQQVHTQSNTVKTLMLIIASDQLPIYVELQKIWKTYMHSDPEHFEVYFIKGDAKLPTLYTIDNDIIWSKTDDWWIPQSAGILNKTLLSIEAMRARLHEFDYVIRTNLSSFYVFPRLLAFLKTLPKQRCYCGSRVGNTDIASGCGFIMSTDVANLLIDNKIELMGQTHTEDDMIIGTFFAHQGLRLIPHNRVDLLTLNTWKSIKNNVPKNEFHFRIKNADDRLRMTDELYIQQKLVKMFYKK